MKYIGIFALVLLLLKIFWGKTKFLVAFLCILAIAVVLASEYTDFSITDFFNL